MGGKKIEKKRFKESPNRFKTCKLSLYVSKLILLIFLCVRKIR